MANRNLVIKDLKRIEVPMPPLGVQLQVTRFLTEKLLYVETLKKLLESQLAEINHLPAVCCGRRSAESRNDSQITQPC